MKTLLLISVLTLALSCGRHNHSGGNSEYLTSNTYTYSRSMQVGNPLDVNDYLMQAVLMNRLAEYHNVKWYLYNGTYLMTSIVTSPRSYRLVR